MRCSAKRSDLNVATVGHGLSANWIAWCPGIQAWTGGGIRSKAAAMPAARRALQMEVVVGISWNVVRTVWVDKQRIPTEAVAIQSRRDERPITLHRAR